MEEAAVTLVVKAANQQIEDQRVTAPPSWTVRRLKGHLAEVYPCKPKSEEQKLIYSGKLLLDTVVLKDVLRTYEGQDTHTVHLVCSPSSAKYGNQSSSKSSSNESSSSSSQPAPSSLPPESNDTGLRQRNVNSTSTPQENVTNNPTNPPNVPYNPYMPYYMSQEQINAWNNQFNQWMAAGNQSSGIDINTVPNVQIPANFDPMMFASQIAWMQQLRMQQVQQYYGMSGISPMNQQMPAANPDSTQDNANQPNAQPINQDPPQNINNDIGNDVENRDWLEWIYNLGRWLLMSSVIYFYSNPMRIFTVIIFSTMMYLFQARIHYYAQNERQQQNLADNLNNNYQRQQDNNERPPNNPTDPDAAPNQNMPMNVANEESFLTIAWTAFTSFFASLIPEVQNGRN